MPMPSASPLNLSRIRENLGRLLLLIKVDGCEKSRTSFNNQTPAGQTKLNSRLGWAGRLGNYFQV
jgi:hypothetical protein